MLAATHTEAKTLHRTSVAAPGRYVVAELFFRAKLVKHLLIQDCFEHHEDAPLVEPVLGIAAFKLIVHLHAAIVFLSIFIFAFLIAPALIFLIIIAA